jgi:hypothetical protein
MSNSGLFYALWVQKMVVYSRLTGYLCKCQARFMLTLEYRTRKQPKNQLLLLKIPSFKLNAIRLEVLRWPLSQELSNSVDRKPTEWIGKLAVWFFRIEINSMILAVLLEHNSITTSLISHCILRTSIYTNTIFNLLYFPFSHFSAYTLPSITSLSLTTLHTQDSVQHYG